MESYSNSKTMSILICTRLSCVLIEAMNFIYMNENRNSLPGVFVRTVFNSPDRSISFLNTVHSLHNVTITELMLELVVTGVRVFHFVLILVLRIRLEY